jgi:D-alanyl-D-alanine carboxypeptidase (penicillin-binding protein 5/6)
LGVAVAVFLSAIAVGGIAAVSTRDDDTKVLTAQPTPTVSVDDSTSSPTSSAVAATHASPPSTGSTSDPATSASGATSSQPPRTSASATPTAPTTSAVSTTAAASVAPPGSNVEPATIPAGTGVPQVSAAAYAVYDSTNGKWLAGSNADEPRAVGSIMKLLTAYVVLAAGDPAHVATVPQLDMDPEESSIGLTRGEKFARDVLFRAMLIVSANDAARTLAVDVAGSTDAFVAQMNAAAADLGLTNTVAANPVGLDEAGAHSSARDIIVLGAQLMQNEEFRAAVAKPTARLHGQTFPNTNGLLGKYKGADGIKTGHTTDAAYCLLASAVRDGRRIIVAVLGEPSEDVRVLDTAALLDWGFAQP